MAINCTHGCCCVCIRSRAKWPTRNDRRQLGRRVSEASQQNAYTIPYKEMHEGLEVIWDESSAEAVAKLRAMDEAGNVTWDRR
jgi:hypothetical protein